MGDRLHPGAYMPETAAIVKAGLFLAIGGLVVCLIVVRLARRLSRSEKALLKLEDELKQAREQLHKRLRS